MSYSYEQLESESALHHTPKSATAHLFSLLKAESEDLLMVIIYAITIGLLSLAVPIGVQSIVNSVAFGAVFQPVVVLTFLVLVLNGFSGILSLIQIFIVERLQQRLFVRVAIDLARRIPRLKAEVFRSEIPQHLINRFFEVVIVQKVVAKIFLEGISVILQACIGLLILAFYHPFLLIFVVLILFSLFFICGVLGFGGVGTSMKESSAKHTVLIWLENIAEHPFLFRSGVGTEYALQRADSVTYNYVKHRRKHFRIVFRQMIGFVVLQTLASALLLGLGGYLVISEQLTLGQLVAAELIVSGVLLSFNKLGKLIENYYDLVASLSKLDSLIELPTEKMGGDDLDASAPLSIEFKDVTASFYRERPVFNNMSFKIEGAGSVAILGENGSGKSLIADLIMRFNQADQGVIRINSQHVADLDPASLREHAKIIRGVEAFRGTIEDNLILGREEISKLSVRSVLESLGLAEDIEKLPQGLNTWLREDARPLSLGQAHRLMIARAILMKPSILIVDELLDSIDERVLDENVLPTLFNLENPCTLIVMTHSHDLAAKFPSRLTIVDGKVLG